MEQFKPLFRQSHKTLILRSESMRKAEVAVSIDVAGRALNKLDLERCTIS